MSYIKKIRYKRANLLSVGWLYIEQDGTRINVDRSTAYMSSILTNGSYWSGNLITYSQTNDPSVTNGNNGVWEITLDKAYKNLKIECYTNATSIELYGEDDKLIETDTYNYYGQPLNEDSRSFGESIRKYIAPIILPLQTIDCNSKGYTGTVEGCVLGTNANSCIGYDIYSSANLDDFRENIQRASSDSRNIRYKIINKIQCINGIPIQPINGILTEWKYENCNNNKRKKTRQCIQPINGA